MRCWWWGQGISFCREENTIRPCQALGTKLPDHLPHPVARKDTEAQVGECVPKVTHP